MPKFTPENAARHGRAGGSATYARHGRAHMRRIGRRGYEQTRDRHFAGDDNALGEWLHRKGTRAQDDRMRAGMPWLRPLTADPGSPEEFMARLYGPVDWFEALIRRAWGQSRASAAAARQPSLADCDTSLCDIPF